SRRKSRSCCRSPRLVLFSSGHTPPRPRRRLRVVHATRLMVHTHHARALRGDGVWKNVASPFVQSRPPTTLGEDNVIFASNTPVCICCPEGKTIGGPGTRVGGPYCSW